jgi:cyclopropane fatty-acyl-phospholipid synthase-like methyltransferase
MTIFGDPIWERVISTQGWGKYPAEEVIRFFIKTKKMMGTENPAVLDIGCGIGACSWFMAKEGGKVTAFDGAPSALGQVKQLAERFGASGEIKTVLGDIAAPKRYFNQLFDIMLDNYSLCTNSYGRIIDAFSDYFTLLGSGGFLLTNCFGKKTTGYGSGTDLGNDTFTDMTEGALSNRGMNTFFDRVELNRIFAEIGFGIEYVENLVEERNGIIVERQVTCLRK